MPSSEQNLEQNIPSTVYFNIKTTKYKNMKSNDEILEEIKLYKSIQKPTYKRYKTNIKQYSSFNGMTMHELIQEAEKEEESGIILKKRTVKKRLMAFQQSLVEKKLENSTIISKMSLIKAVYHFYEITLPKLPSITNNHYETIDDIVTNEDIKKALLNCKFTETQAIIMFMASSGTAINEASRLTIYDFLKATETYHKQKNFDNPRQIIKKLEDFDDIVPCFNLIRYKTHYPYYTFCTPEATKKIIQMLKERYRYKPIVLDDRLFGASDRAIIKRFSRLNDRCNFGWKKNSRFFHSHNLRKYFITTCFNEGLDYVSIEFMVGHKLDPVKAAYIKANPEKQRKKYMAFMNNLTFFDKVMYNDINSKEKLELESLRDYKIRTEARIAKMESMLSLLDDLKL